MKDSSVYMKRGLFMQEVLQHGVRRGVLDMRGNLGKEQGGIGGKCLISQSCGGLAA